MAHYDSSATYDGSVFYDEAAPSITKKRMAKVKLDLRNKDDAGLLTFSQQHILAMTGNADFVTPTPTAVDFLALHDAYEAALDSSDMAQQTALQKVSMKDVARVNLETALTQRGNYIDLNCGGSEAKILSTNLGVRASTSTPIGQLLPPSNLRVSGGDLEGENDVQWDPRHGTESYLAESALAADGPWTQFYVGKKSSCTATGLVSGTLYFFRVKAKGAAGFSGWSDIASKRAT